MGHIVKRFHVIGVHKGLGGWVGVITGLYQESRCISICYTFSDCKHIPRLLTKMIDLLLNTLLFSVTVYDRV